VGLGLVTLPLLVGVGTAALKLSDLLDESSRAVIASTDATSGTSQAQRALTNMFRHASQYVESQPVEGERNEAILDREAILKRFVTASESLTAALSSLANLEFSTDIATDIGQIQATQAAWSASLADPGITKAKIDSQYNNMNELVGSIKDQMQAQISARLAQLEEETRSSQSALAWQAAALLPGTLILVAFFALLVGRPMRQIDRAIRELGKGNFSNSIAISGPADIETLGRQLEWLRQRLRESTEEKNKFLRHMSHELKTPLANIREGTELLLDGVVGDLDLQQTEVTTILRDNGVKLQRLIENLLTFSAWHTKTAALDITSFELKPFVFSTLSQHKLAIANREIRLDLDIAPVRVRADEAKLRLVLENLVSNAVKFTPRDGQIAVRARHTAGELIIEVEDSGPGIPADERERVFEAFFQGRRIQGGPVGGTGIGLSVVSECVQAHAGTIKLKTESTLGGAHFEVRLPMQSSDGRPRLVVANA
jgi:two-component system sensor histidine kinase GlrK